MATEILQSDRPTDAAPQAAPTPPALGSVTLADARAFLAQPRDPAFERIAARALRGRPPERLRIGHAWFRYQDDTGDYLSEDRHSWQTFSVADALRLAKAVQS